MNIFTTVLDSVAASAADIVTSGGKVSITGLSRSIPQKGVVAARRLLVGELLRKYTITVASAQNNTTYKVNVQCVDPVSGSQRSYPALFTTPSSGNTTTTVATGLAAALGQIAGAPFTVTTSTNTVIVQMVTGTPSAVVSATDVLCTVADSTAAQTGTVTIATTGAVTGSGTTLPAVGTVIVSSDGTDFYRGVIATRASGTAATVLPFPPAEIAAGSSFYLLNNAGSYIESFSSWANLVSLTAATTYVVYEIDAVTTDNAGNSANPGFIDNKYLLFLNSADTDVWGSGNFDTVLQTALGVSF